MDRDDVDAQLAHLLPPLAEALSRRVLVIAMNLWRPLPAAALLPFHVALRWPDRVDEAPLHARATVVPCAGAARRLMEEPLYPVADAYGARMYARSWRREAGVSHPDDFLQSDWEEGYRRNQERLACRALGGASYLGVDVVTPAGVVVQGRRPVLGQIAGRAAPRPCVLIPGRGRLSDAALDLLAASPLVVVDVQGVRGVRTLEVARGVLARRRDRATLVVASSPGDVFALGLPDVEATAPLHAPGAAPALEGLIPLLVARERPLEERRFDFAVTALRGQSAALDEVLDLAEGAWWAARQSLDPASARTAILPRLQRAVERLRLSSSSDAGQLTSALALLDETIGDARRAAERLAALLDAAEGHFDRPAGWRTAIIVRNGIEAEVVRAALGERWDTSYTEIRRLGLEVRSGGIPPTGKDDRADSIVASGYTGTRTLDAIFAGGARCATMILDPVEARVAHHHAARMRRFLERGAHPAVLAVLDRVAAACATVMAPASAAPVSVDLDRSARQVSVDDAPSAQDRLQGAGPAERMLITFTDGTSLACPAHQSLDVLRGDGVPGLRGVEARALCPGDDVVVVVHETQARFSDALLRIQDRGPLRDAASKRRQWLTLVALAKEDRRRTYKSIHVGLQARGIRVDYHTVRGWIPSPAAVDGGAVPKAWDAFKALADELGLPLPEEMLRSHYRAVRVLRTRHRQAGRDLVRLMRHAAMGRLDAATLHNVETQWGMGTRDLLEGTRLRTVDDVTEL